MVDSPTVVFGAGNIGRGLLAELVSRERRSVVFVEALPELAERLRHAGKYEVHLTGERQETRLVQNYTVVDAMDPAALSTAVKRAGLIATAVGAPNLPAVAAALAPALAAPAWQPLPILVCENQHGADGLLTAALMEQGAPAEAFACIATSIERMVRTAPDSLNLYAEAGQSLYVDRSQWDATAAGRSLPEGFLLVDALDAYYARKLYTNNAGHALLAYMGQRHGHLTIAQAAAAPQIAAPLQQLLDAAARALVLDYGLDSAAVARHVQELVAVRFANQALADPIRRVARQPLRKIGPHDRLVGLLRRLEPHGLPTTAVCQAIAAAMHYRDDNDDQSRELAALIAQGGPALVLQKICGIGPDEPAFDSIVTHFKADKP